MTANWRKRAIELSTMVINTNEAKIVLDRNQETFDTYMHRRIWGQWASLVPIEKTLPFVDDEYKNSCIDLYNFFTAVFEDMYVNIESYDLLPNDIPELSYEAKLLKKKPEMPFWFLFHLALKSEIDENGHMVLSTAVYEKFKKTRKELYAANFLGKHGITISEFPDITVISNTKYPDMFRIIVRMASNDKTKYNLMNCDFRVFNKIKLDGFELVTETLSGTHKNFAMEIDKFLLSKDIKREKNLSVGRIIYRYNKEIIAYMYREDNRLTFPIMFDFKKSIPFEVLCEKLAIYDYCKELITFALDNLKPCTFCRDNPVCAKSIKYNEKEVLFCNHRGGVYFTEFDERSVATLKQFIDVKISFG